MRRTPICIFWVYTQKIRTILFLKAEGRRKGFASSFCLLACLLIFLAFNVYAQELDFERLTLEDAITYALEHSPKIKQAKITVALAEIDLKQTSWWNWFVPSLTLHQGYEPALAESRLGVGISFDLNKILGGGKREGKRARLKLFDVETYLSTIETQVIAEVTKSYYDYIIAQKNIEILEEQLQNSVKLQEILKLKFESASATINQLLAVNDATSKTKLELLKANAEMKLNVLKLKQEMGYK